MPAYGPDSSRDADLPSMAQGLVRSLQLAYRAEPRLLLVSSSLLIASWMPEALNALWLKYLAQGLIDRRSGLVQAAALGLALSAIAAWLLRTLGARIELRFRERATIFVESHVARLQAATGTIEHHERPEHLDRLQMLREQAFLLNHLWGAFMSTAGSRDASGFLRDVRCLPPLQRFQRFGVVAAHLPKALIIMEAVLDRGRELRKTPNHAFQPVVHVFPVHQAVALTPSFSFS
jgi:hypothetical protein